MVVCCMLLWGLVLVVTFAVVSCYGLVAVCLDWCLLFALFG